MLFVTNGEWLAYNSKPALVSSLLFQKSPQYLGYSLVYRRARHALYASDEALPVAVNVLRARWNKLPSKNLCVQKLSEPCRLSFWFRQVIYFFCANKIRAVIRPDCDWRTTNCHESFISHHTRTSYPTWNNLKVMRWNEISILSQCICMPELEAIQRISGLHD